MNEEFNNDYNNGYNQDSNNMNQGNEQNIVDNSNGNYSGGAMNQTNSQSENNTQNTVYPTPEPIKEEKPKNKKRGFGIVKLTAAALAFGLIAGAGFQGYFMIAGNSGNAVNTDIQSNGKITETADKSNSGEAVETSSNASSDAVATDVSDIVKKVMPSIVAINCKATTTSYDFFGGEYSQNEDASGSGIIIGQNDSKLLIATNNHVVDKANSVQVVFSDGKTASAQIKGTDTGSDLAVISVDMKNLSASTKKTIKVATLGDSDKVEAGDMAIAIGNALGYGQSVTVGYISAVNREVTINNNTMKLLQTDAAINPGNSGGALINSKGQVIGINSVKYASEEVESMGYAIPISTAIPMINELINRQTVSSGEQGYLGINADTAKNVTEEYSKRFNIPIGVYVNDIVNGSPADKAGLQSGNIITGVDGVTIKTIDDLVNALSYKKEGQEIKLKIQTKSNGDYVERTLNVTLGKKN